MFVLNVTTKGYNYTNSTPQKTPYTYFQLIIIIDCKNSFLMISNIWKLAHMLILWNILVFTFLLISIFFAITAIVKYNSSFPYPVTDFPQCPDRMSQQQWTVALLSMLHQTFKPKLAFEVLWCTSKTTNACDYLKNYLLIFSLVEK